MTALTQRDLDLFKAQFPNDEKIQAVTLIEVLENSDGKADFSKWTREPAPALLEGSVLSCGAAIGFVIYDCVSLFIGASATRAGATTEEAEAIAKAAEPVLSKIEKVCADAAKEGASAYDKACAVWEIIKTIYNGGCLGAVIGAFLSTLTWYNMILYGATALATIVAALATDGAAEIAEIAIQLATFGFLVSDSIAVGPACS